ncbi:MAG: undecaprenyl-diphosphate phosphatase [Oscillospiraceae bacterium]|nr:undecaprenyl-diphosphate phosphatase [Oscillospiraceae bacterium]
MKDLELNWFQSVLYGLLSGLMDILPVSAQAHRALLLKFYGIKGNGDFLNLLIHLGILCALYWNSQSQLIRMSRARALARVPKRKRKRPLDTKSLMDLSMLKTMLIPVILGLFLYRFVSDMSGSLMWIALFLFLNGVILYVPQFLPSSNRDSRTLSRVEGLLMGLGGAASILPGISAVGVTTSIGSVCGVERSYSLDMALLMNMILTIGLAVYDVMGIMANGMDVLSFSIILRYLLTAAAAFGGAMLGIKFMRHLASNQGFSLFGVYCWGLALFTFILNLIA